MITYGGVEVLFHTFLTSALYGSSQIHSPAALSLEKEPPVSTEANSIP
jgi:hypothetical protein